MQLRRLLSALLFPQQNACHLCGHALDGFGLFCAECEHGMLECLLPSSRQERGALGQLGGSVSVLRYRGNARRMVHLLKYDTDTAVAAWLGERMAASVLARPSFACAHAVMPVPLHPARYRRRGYNQSLLLAQELCSRTGQPLLADALIRVRDTGTQVGRSRAERLHALHGAFAVPQPQQVRGLRILLVDDVLTTGATALACAEALVHAGAAEVLLVTACLADGRV